MAVDVLVLTALKEELDALLQVQVGWTSTDGDPPLHSATLDGRSGPLRIAAARLTKMGGVATASLATRLIEIVKPRCIAMCGVCAGHPEDTDLGDVVIAERLFQHNEGKIRHDGFQGDLWVDALRDDWLRVAQDMAGPGAALDLFAAPSSDDWKWWFLEHLAAGRDPLRSHAFRRYIPDDHRQEYLQFLLKERLVKLQGTVFALTSAGKTAAAGRRVLYGTLVNAHAFHIHIGPMGSGNAVEAGGVIWDRLAVGGMRKVLAVEMEAAAIGRVAHERGLPFAVVKGVMDHADGHKSDRFKGFAARVAAEVLCKLLREVVVPPRVTSPVTSSDPPPLLGALGEGDRAATQEAPWVFGASPHILAKPWDEELHTLLASVLSAEELHRWVHFNFVDLRTNLPSATQSDPEGFAFTVLDRLTKRGHITEDFFRKLASKLGASHHPRVEAISTGWRSCSIPITAPQPAPPTQLAAPTNTPTHPPSPTVTRTTLVLDRIEQWKAIRERCDDDPRHLAFIVHGTPQQNVALFAERLVQYLKEGRVRKHGTPHRVDRRGDGSTAVTAGDWIGRTIAATDRQRPPLESALRFEAQHHAPSFIYFEGNAALHDLGRDSVDGLTTFLKSDLPKALAVTDFKHPLRFFFPIEDDLPLARALHDALSLPTARKHIQVHDILELKFPNWPEIEEYIHEHFGAVPEDVRGACKRCYDAADLNKHDLRSLADGLKDILHDWEDANH